jgi:hypothetical protein
MDTYGGSSWDYFNEAALELEINARPDRHQNATVDKKKHSLRSAEQGELKSNINSNVTKNYRLSRSETTQGGVLALTFTF